MQIMHSMFIVSSCISVLGLLAISQSGPELKDLANEGEDWDAI
jgi:hypothetical protein